MDWHAQVFLTLYLQLIGMSDFAASALMSLFLSGTAAGGKRSQNMARSSRTKLAMRLCQQFSQYVPWHNVSLMTPMS